MLREVHRALCCWASGVVVESVLWPQPKRPTPQRPTPVRFVTQPAHPAREHRDTLKRVSVACAALLAIALLFFSLRGIEWRRVGGLAAHAHPVPLLLAALASTGTLFVRAIRWRVLLNSEGRVSVRTAFWATSAGYFGNNFLPARGGELVRTYIVSAAATLDTAFVLATALSERVADAVALIAIAAVVLVRMPSQSAWMARGVPLIAAAALLCVIAIAVLPYLSAPLAAVLQRSPLPHGFRQRLLLIVEQVLRGMRAFHDVRRLSTFAVLTAVIWSGDAVAATITGTALGLQIPYRVAFLLLAGLGLGSALPSTPGYIGIYQFVAVMVLTPFGFSHTEAITYILVAQALGYVVVGFWGALALGRYRTLLRVPVSKVQ